jgi:hypothetical protein
LIKFRREDLSQVSLCYALLLGIQSIPRYCNVFHHYLPKHIPSFQFLEAYGSRFAPLGTVYLASRKRLQKEHCSGIARLHFDQIHNLKDDLRCVGFLPTQTLPNAATAIEEWLPRVLQALKGLFVDRNENRLFCHVLQRLRETRDELPALILPKTEAVA